MASGLKARFAGSAVWPALLSGLVAPGLGQIYNREYGKGLILLVASIGSFFWFSKTVTEALAMILPGSPEQWTNDPNVFREAIKKVVQLNPDMFVTFEILVLLVWIFGIVDAYLTARRLPRDTEPPRETPDA